MVQLDTRPANDLCHLRLATWSDTIVGLCATALAGYHVLG
jgi:hypothetical protein